MGHNGQNWTKGFVPPWTKPLLLIGGRGILSVMGFDRSLEVGDRDENSQLGSLLDKRLLLGDPKQPELSHRSTTGRELLLQCLHPDPAAMNFLSAKVFANSTSKLPVFRPVSDWHFKSLAYLNIYYKRRLAKKLVKSAIALQE